MPAEGKGSKRLSHLGELLSFLIEGEVAHAKNGGAAKRGDSPGDAGAKIEAKIVKKYPKDLGIHADLHPGCPHQPAHQKIG